MMDEIQKAMENLNTSGMEVSGKVRRVSEFYGALDTAIIAMQELLGYRQIGTVQECWEAREKQKPKQVLDRENFGRCPACDEEFNSELLNEYNIEYCPWCGQKLDWRDGE